MKLIRIGMSLFVLCFCFSLGVMAQIIEIENPETKANDSLVNVAFGTVKINDLSGAISVMNPAEYLDKSFGNYALDGSTAYVGGNNFWNLGNVLVLINGVPRSVSDITLTEIEQITYLKGASAVVLYGSHAANGVIQITTKRGKNDKSQINVRVNSGINLPKAYPKYLGAADYMRYYNQACANDGLAELYDSTTIGNYSSQSNPYLYPDVDYYSSDYLRKMSNTHMATADFTGGNDRAHFYASTGFENQNSLLKIGEGKNEGITRMNVRGNIDLIINEYINTFVDVSAVFYDARTANGNYWQQSGTLHPHRYAPLIPIDLVEQDNDPAQNLVDASRHVIDGKYILGGTQEYLTNPIADAYAAGYSTYTSRQFQYSAGLNADLMKIMKGLSFHTQVSVDYSNSYRQSINNSYAVFVPKWTKYAETDSISDLTKYNKDSNNGNQNLSENWNNQNIDFNLHFDYLNTFQGKHNLMAKVIVNGFRGRRTAEYQNRTNTNLALQFNYNYLQKYYVNFNGAIVNSTKLPVNTRVAFSPTLEFGWVLSEEEFLKSSSVVDRLKVHASAGLVNTDIDFQNYYMYDQIYASTAYFSWKEGTWTNRTTTMSHERNDNLGYVKRKEVNVGVNGALFNNSLNFDINAFMVRKDGIPVQRYTKYPSFFYTYYPETSFVPYENYNANSYTGLDFQINYTKKIGEFNLELGVAGTYVTAKALIREELYADAYRNRAGKDLGAIFGLQSEGLFMSQDEINNHAVQKFGEVKPGDISYKDQNNDGVVDERDEVMIGSWMSPLTAGLHLTANWKDLTLFVIGNGAFGGTSMKGGDYYWISGNKKYSEVVLDSWTEQNKQDAKYPRLTTLGGDNNFRNSDFWSYKSDVFNLARVQLTYSLPKEILKQSFVKSFDIYLNGSNLLYVSNNKDIMELNVGSTPQTRTFSLGVKAVF